ncbi:MAG: flippase-like domain-containing protein [Candidatus Hydrogenedentes bacterium]|nr:flippase-like domain-containing protein [Candidatus Hydrogenedentota bacterium]
MSQKGSYILNSSNWLQFLGVLLLLGFTVYGILTFHQEDWDYIWKILYNKSEVILLVLTLRLIDWVIDFGVWRYVLFLYGISISFINSILVYMTQGAGILLPVQMGRVVRGYVLSKKFNVLGELCFVAELHMLIVVFSGAFLTFSIFLGEYANMRFFIWVTSFAGLTIIWIFIRYGGKLFIKLFPYLPQVKGGYLAYLILSIVCALGWFINGLIFFYLLESDGTNLSFVEAQLVLLGGVFLGAISGIPGGLGILEMVLGVSLYWFNIKTPEIIIVISIFRLLTYWLWIPLGWLAMVILGIRSISKGLQKETL